jgi:NAD+ kinase
LEVTGNDPSAQCLVHSLLDEHRTLDGVSKLHQIVDMATQTTHQPAHLQVVPHRDSRVLSKKQLSDMAFGIRELSKNLAHMKLKLKVQNIFVLGKAHDETVVLLTRELVSWLLDADQSHRVYVPRVYCLKRLTLIQIYREYLGEQ